MDFYTLLGDHFIAAGDYNAKHTHWESRLVTPKERQLYNAIIKPNNKLDYVSPGSPTYWPTDLRKVPELIDFAVTKNIPLNKIRAKALSDPSSDLSPVLITLLQSTKTTDHHLKLTSHKTNLLKYKKYVSSHFKLSPHFNIEADIALPMLLKKYLWRQPLSQHHKAGTCKPTTSKLICKLNG